MTLVVMDTLREGCPEALLSLQAWRRRPWNFSHHSFEVEIASHLFQWVDSHPALYPIVSEHCKHLPPALPMFYITCIVKSTILLL